MPVRTSLPRLLAASVLVLATASSASSCGANVNISLSDPEGLRDQATWTEFDIFEGGCPPEEDLVTGQLPDPVKRQVVDASSELPAPGSLPAKTYGFSVLLRDSTCGITAYGCVKANVEKVREIKININPTVYDPPAGACEAPLSCVEGQCSEEGGGGGAGGDGGGGSPGTLPNECAKEKSGASGCKLEVFGFGELPAATGAKVGGPVVIPMSKGFLVAYHEIQSGGAKRTVSSIAVGADGCYQNPISQAESEECGADSAANFDPGLGGAWNSASNQGMVVFSRRRCPGSGIGRAAITADGTLNPLGPFDNDGASAPFLFTPQGALIGAPEANRFVLLYTTDGVPQGFGFAGNMYDTSVSSPFTDAPGGSPSGVLFSAHTASGTRVAQVTGNSSKSLLRLSTGGAAVFAELPGAKDMRLRFSSDGLVTAFRTASGDGIDWAAYDTTGAKQFPTDETASKSLTTGSLGYDTTTLDDKIIFVTGASGGFNLQLFNTGTFASFKSQAFEASNFSGLDGFDGKQIAVGATSGRIAVAWVTSQPKAGKPVGGVAVLKCE